MPLFLVTATASHPSLFDIAAQAGVASTLDRDIRPLRYYHEPSGQRLLGLFAAPSDATLRRRLPAGGAAEVRRVIVLAPNEHGMPVTREEWDEAEPLPTAPGGHGLMTVGRTVGGAGVDDMVAGALRGYMCAAEYPGMHWVCTFWAPEHGQSVCLFTASSVEDLRDHAQRALIPCDEVRPAIEVMPPLALLDRPAAP